MTLDKALTWFINVWVALVVALNFIVIFAVLWTAPTIWAAITKIWDMFDPFNVVHFIAEFMVVSPAFGAYLWRERLRDRRSS